MKNRTAEEIFKNEFDKHNKSNDNKLFHFGYSERQVIIKAMHEFSNQHRPKWVSVSKITESGKYFGRDNHGLHCLIHIEDSYFSVTYSGGAVEDLDYSCSRGYEILITPTSNNQNK